MDTPQAERVWSRLARYVLLAIVLVLLVGWWWNTSRPPQAAFVSRPEAVVLPTTGDSATTQYLRLLATTAPGLAEVDGAQALVDFGNTTCVLMRQGTSGQDLIGIAYQQHGDAVGKQVAAVVVAANTFLCPDVDASGQSLTGTE